MDNEKGEVIEASEVQRMKRDELFSFLTRDEVIPSVRLESGTQEVGCWLDWWLDKIGAKDSQIFYCKKEGDHLVFGKVDTKIVY